MHIMTDRGWVQLSPKIDMAVMEIVQFNDITRKYEPVQYGQIREIGRIDHAPPSFKPYDWEAYWVRELAWRRDVLGEVDHTPYVIGVRAQGLASSKYAGD